MPPRGKKISLGEFQNQFSSDTHTPNFEDQRRITSEEIAYSAMSGGYGSYRDREPRYNDYHRPERERIEHVPVPVPDEPPFRAFIRNLPRNFTERDVAEVFGDHEIEEISVPTSFEGGNKGFCFVSFKKREDLQYFAEEVKEIPLESGDYLKVDVSNPARRDDRRGGFRENSLADSDDNWRSARAQPTRGRGGFGGRGGDRFGDRGDRFGDRGDRGDRFGDRGDRGDRFGDRDVDRFGDRGGRYGGDRGGRYGGDRFGERPGRSGGDRFGERRGPSGGFGRFRESVSDQPKQEQYDSDAIYLDSVNPFGDSKPITPKEDKPEE